MDDIELRIQLQRLRDEYDQLPADASARPQLAELIGAVEQHLAQASGAQTQDQLREGIDNAIRRFEVEHPKLTATLGSLLDTLSSMGI